MASTPPITLEFLYTKVQELENENKIIRKENAVLREDNKKIREELKELQTKYDVLQTKYDKVSNELGKIQIRDLLSGFAREFARQFGTTVKMLVERGTDHFEEAEVDLSQVKHLDKLLEWCRRELNKQNPDVIAKYEALKAHLKGADPFEVALYCHQNIQQNVFSQMAYPLLTFISQPTTRTPENKEAALKILENLSPMSRKHATTLLDLVVREGVVFQSPLAPQSHSPSMKRKSPESGGTSSHEAASSSDPTTTPTQTKRFKFL